ncbi:unnamed protein product [Rotaria sp. Silwood1]|nr:unnamed protein product [Rotaria sp. Silwood1]CAF1690793.1 unnamed protein product [Rotaria sp. Silwood1]
MSTVQPPTVSSIPALHAFDSRTSSWQSYRDRISFYFQANRIHTDEDKKALFLWSVGDTTYNLLESLISPRSLTDEDTMFTDLIKLLDAHYDATKNIMTSTYDFYSCYQKSGQTFTEWKAELCEKLRHCGFTTSALKDKPQDRALRDMYVIGIKSQKIRQALLKEQDPDLETTEKIIQLAERLEEDVRHFGNPIKHDDYAVAKLHNSQPKREKQPQNKSFVKNEYKPCETCGSTRHLRSKCRYREFICNFCKKTGHLEKVCRQKKNEKLSTKHIATIYKLNCSNQTNQSIKHSSTIPLKVNGYDFTFELDTGTFNTIISMEDWYKLGSPTIHPSKLKLKCYSGNALKIKGECNVKVQYQNQSYNLSMIIIYGASPPLLGLQWINIMQLDLNQLIHAQHSVQHSIHKIYTSSKLQTTLQKHKNVLRSYRWTPHTTTGTYPANMLLQHQIRTELDIMKPHESIKPRQQTKYAVGQLVWTLKHQLNKRPQWQQAIITKNISSMIYEIQLRDGQRYKRHQNQLRPRYSSNTQSSEIGSLPDDLLNTKSQSKTTTFSHSSSPRYRPRRNRKPPDRYTP